MNEDDGPPVIDHTEAEDLPGRYDTSGREVPVSHCGHRHTYGHCIEIPYD